MSNHCDQAVDQLDDGLLPLQVRGFLPQPVQWPNLARRGDMQVIGERAAHIETLGEQYVPFANKPHELAKGFEERAMLALVEQYIEENK